MERTEVAPSRLPEFKAIEEKVDAKAERRTCSPAFAAIITKKPSQRCGGFFFTRVSVTNVTG